MKCAVTEFRKLYSGTKLSGFVFLVDGQFTWTTDTDALLRIGGWLNGMEQLGGIRRTYLTTRNHGGFAIVFRKHQDALAFLNVCLLTKSIFTDPNPFYASFPTIKNRTTKQLPGPDNRSLSKMFPNSILKTLSMEIQLPFGAGSGRVKFL